MAANHVLPEDFGAPLSPLLSRLAAVAPGGGDGAAGERQLWTLAASGAAGAEAEKAYRGDTHASFEAIVEARAAPAATRARLAGSWSGGAVVPRAMETLQAGHGLVGRLVQTMVDMKEEMGVL